MANIPDPLRAQTGAARRYMNLPDSGAGYIVRGVQDVSRSLSGFAQQSTQIAVDKIERDRRANSAVQRINAKTEYERVVRDTLLEYEQDPAFVDRDIEDVRRELEEKTAKARDQIMQGVTFHDDGEAEILNAQLAAASTNAESSLLNLHSKRTAERVNNLWIEKGNTLSASLYDDPTPDNLFAAITNLQEMGEEFAPTLGAAKLEAAARDQVAGMIGTTVRSLVDQKRFGEAEALLKGQWVDPGTGKRTSFDSIIGGDGKAALMDGIRVERQRHLKKRQQKYVASFKQWAAFTRAGGEGAEGSYTPDEIAANVFDPDAQAEILEMAEEARAEGQAARAIKWASPEEATQLFEGLTAEIQDPANIDDYSDNVAKLNRLASAYEQRQKSLRADPAAVLIKENPDIGEAWAALNSEGAGEGERLSYVAATVAEQERLGLRDGQVKLLPKAFENEIVAQFYRQNEGGENAATLIQGLEQQWGDYWPEVYAQLSDSLPGEALVIGSGVPPATALQLAELSGIKESDLLDGLPKGSKNDAEEALRDHMEDFEASLVGLPGGMATFETFRSSLSKLQLSYMRRGKSAGDAAQMAYGEVIGSKYAFIAQPVGGPYRVPAAYNEGEIERGARATLENLHEAPVAIPQSLMGIDDEAARRQYLSAVQEGGYWVTAPNEGGLVLYDSTGSAVMSQNEEALTYSWDDLRRIGMGALKSSVEGMQVPGAL